MISVDEAVERIAHAFLTLPTETVSLMAGLGRVLAEDAVAKCDQPPDAMSAMDGYAVAANSAGAGTELKVIGESPAGRPYRSAIKPGETVRIFTGGVVPEGADAVVIQEDTEVTGARVIVKETPRLGENVRPRGLDFHSGDVLLKRGHRLHARDLALLAAADFAAISVMRKPRIAIVATGDELSRPGEPRKDGGIVASSTYALQAMVEEWGGKASDIGIFPDRPEAFANLTDAAKDTDLIVTTGGASVGDHDLVQSALSRHGFVLDFWKIAMRPGKPLIFGRLKETPLLGLPGNPVSAMVCAYLFLKPAIATMLGMSYRAPLAKARLTAPLRANGRRQDYIRARIEWRDGTVMVEPFALQDSSMQRVFAQSDALIVRAIDAPAASPGEIVDVFLLGKS